MAELPYAWSSSNALLPCLAFSIMNRYVKSMAARLSSADMVLLSMMLRTVLNPTPSALWMPCTGFSRSKVGSSGRPFFCKFLIPAAAILRSS